MRYPCSTSHASVAASSTGTPTSRRVSLSRSNMRLADDGSSWRYAGIRSRISSNVSGRLASRSSATRSISRSSGCIPAMIAEHNAGMIRLRTGTVVAILEERPGAVELSVTVDAEAEPSRAIAYPALVGPVRPGDRVRLNTTAMALGLGTGGLHVVIAVEGSGDLEAQSVGRIMKLRYTPEQVNVLSVEEPASPHTEAMAAAE